MLNELHFDFNYLKIYNQSQNLLIFKLFLYFPDMN